MFSTLRLIRRMFRIGLFAWRIKKATGWKARIKLGLRVALYLWRLKKKADRKPDAEASAPPRHVQG